MMQRFLFRLGQNWHSRRQDTVGVLLGLFFATLIISIFVNAIIPLGIIGFLLTAAGVVWGASRIPRLAWFWGRPDTAETASTSPGDEADSKASTMETPSEKVSQEIPTDERREDGVPPPSRGQMQADEVTPILGAPRPRATPQGTQLIKQSPERAVMKVKSAVRFWSWFLPPFFLITMVITIVPITGVLAAAMQKANNFRRGLDAYLFDAGAVVFACFIGAAVLSYYLTRPSVRITVTPEAVKYGSEYFDRRFHHGVRTGWSMQGVELQNSFFDKSFGLQALRFTYGRWGEDLPYMVNAYHAQEIVIWMNEIIDQVGAPPAPSNDPYAGHKTELL